MKPILNMAHDTTAIGTVGGTVFALITIPTQTMATTVICAVIGATTSFLVTITLKGIWNKIKNRK